MNATILKRIKQGIKISPGKREERLILAMLVGIIPLKAIINIRVVNLRKFKRKSAIE